MDDLLGFLNRLEKAKINYSLGHNRNETIMVLVAVPGERWEVEFFSDGNVDIEIFKSHGEMKDKSEIERLFEEFSE
jgi:hypothetical protein